MRLVCLLGGGLGWGQGGWVRGERGGGARACPGVECSPHTKCQESDVLHVRLLQVCL